MTKMGRSLFSKMPPASLLIILLLSFAFVGVFSQSTAESVDSKEPVKIIEPPKHSVEAFEKFLFGEELSVVGGNPNMVDRSASRPLAGGAGNTVAGVIASRTCETVGVAGLARQIVETMDCLKMGSFRSILNIPHLTLSAAAKAVPYLQKGAADALEKAAAATPGGLTVNSAIRTVPQQLLIWMKLQRKQCGFRAAANPDNSNHLSGASVDLQQARSVINQMNNNGFSWLGAWDPWHYDWNARRDLRAANVKAFQLLYNKCNPAKETLSTDGRWGPQTENAMMKSPAAGWAGCGFCPQHQKPSSPVAPKAEEEGKSGGGVETSTSSVKPVQPAKVTSGKASAKSQDKPLVKSAGSKAKRI